MGQGRAGGGGGSGCKCQLSAKISSICQPSKISEQTSLVWSGFALGVRCQNCLFMAATTWTYLAR